MNKNKFFFPLFLFSLFYFNITHVYAAQEKTELPIIIEGGRIIQIDISESKDKSDYSLNFNASSPCVMTEDKFEHFKDDPLSIVDSKKQTFDFHFKQQNDSLLQVILSSSATEFQIDFQNSDGEVRNWSAFTEKPFIYEFYPEKYISNLSSQDLGYHYKTRNQLTLYLRSYAISEENVSIYLDGISDYLTDNQLNFLEENSYVNGKHDFFSSGSVENSWERTEKYIQKDLLKFESQLFANNQTIDTVRIILRNPRLEFIFESEDSSRFVTKVEFDNDIIFSFPDLQSNNLNNRCVTYHITEEDTE